MISISNARRIPVILLFILWCVCRQGICQDTSIDECHNGQCTFAARVDRFEEALAKVVIINQQTSLELNQVKYKTFTYENKIKELEEKVSRLENSVYGGSGTERTTVTGNRTKPTPPPSPLDIIQATSLGTLSLRECPGHGVYGLARYQDTLYFTCGDTNLIRTMNANTLKTGEVINTTFPLIKTSSEIGICENSQSLFAVHPANNTNSYLPEIWRYDLGGTGGWSLWAGPIRGLWPIDRLISTRLFIDDSCNVYVTINNHAHIYDSAGNSLSSFQTKENDLVLPSLSQKGMYAYFSGTSATLVNGDYRQVESYIGGRNTPEEYGIAHFTDVTISLGYSMYFVSDKVRMNVAMITPELKVTRILTRIHSVKNIGVDQILYSHSDRKLFVGGNYYGAELYVFEVSTTVPQ